MKLTLFPDVSGEGPLEQTTDPVDLAERIANPHSYPSKEACPLIKLATFGKHRKVNGNGKAGSLRNDENVLEVYGVEGDYDGQQVPMREAAAKVEAAGITAMFHTSPRHKPEAPRWRVLAPFAKPQRPERRAPILARLNGVLGGILASESFTLSQAYYFGHVNGAPYDYATTAGDCIDTRDDLDGIAVGRTVRAPETPSVGDPAPEAERVRALQLATEAALRTQNDGTRGRHHEAYLLGCILKRERFTDIGAIADPVLNRFITDMRTCDTSGKVTPIDRPKLRKAIEDGYRDAAVASEIDLSGLIGKGSAKASPPSNLGHYAWPEPVDPFAEVVVPRFPVDCLAPHFARFARAHAAQTGFDEGAYGFELLVSAGNSLDHRSRLAITDAFRVPPVLWGGLVDPSGGGKSPTIKIATAPVERENQDLLHLSKEAYAEWTKLAPQEQRAQDKPAWRQRHALDITVEALGDLLKDNPEGVNIYADELTEFIGRMDAYSKGSSKDRSTYLRAYDGGPVTINRRTGHLHVENFSVGILAGIQPEKLVELFRRNGGGADGLYQRFLFYNMAPAGAANYEAKIDPYTDVDVYVLIKNLWGVRVDTRLSEEARAAANNYHNALRTVAQRTAGGRFGEHLNKFPGFINRVAFVLHCIEAACGRHAMDGPVTLETWDRAKKVMACLYRHSEAVYARLDAAESEAVALVKSAAEAILSKRWERFSRSDLTRNATGWRAATPQTAEGAIDLLIEYGWLLDVTQVVRGKRGRRSDGKWLVNPAAHVTFAEHTKRIRHARSERYAAIQAAASERVDCNS